VPNAQTAYLATGKLNYEGESDATPSQAWSLGYTIPAGTPGTNLILSLYGGSSWAAGLTMNSSTLAATFAGAVTAPSLNGMTTPTPAGLATLTQNINHGTITLEGGTAIAAGACATVVTTASASVLTTDIISAGFNGDETGVTGYIPGAALTPYVYPTAGNVNVKLCNGTASSITPTSIVLNWTDQR
jgi:hypothetical protein